MKRRLLDVPLERVRPSPHNPRHEAVGIDDLAASIRAIGIVEPLIVSVDAKHPEHVTLVCGSRRFAAARQVGLKTVPCVVLPMVGERTERTVSLVENLHRREMSHIEQGEAFLALIRTGMTQDQVGRQAGVSSGTVSMKVRLVTDLIPELRPLVHRDAMTVKEALKIAALPRDDQRRIHAGERRTRRPSHVAASRRTKTEAALMMALAAYRDGDLDMARVEAERAATYLRNGNVKVPAA